MPENNGYIDMLPSQPVHVNGATNHDQNDHNTKSMGCQHWCKPSVNQRNGLRDESCLHDGGNFNCNAVPDSWMHTVYSSCTMHGRPTLLLPWGSPGICSLTKNVTLSDSWTTIKIITRRSQWVATRPVNVGWKGADLWINCNTNDISGKHFDIPPNQRIQNWPKINNQKNSFRVGSGKDYCISKTVQKSITGK